MMKLPFLVFNSGCLPRCLCNGACQFSGQVTQETDVNVSSSSVT